MMLWFLTYHPLVTGSGTRIISPNYEALGSVVQVTRLLLDGNKSLKL
jgi:hypothetical protein